MPVPHSPVIWTPLLNDREKGLFSPLYQDVLLFYLISDTIWIFCQILQLLERDLKKLSMYLEEKHKSKFSCLKYIPYMLQDKSFLYKYTYKTLQKKAYPQMIIHRFNNVNISPLKPVSLLQVIHSAFTEW